MVIVLKLERKSLTSWLQYLYFLRVSIIGWWLLPLLCFLDWHTGLSALTRGIMTLGSGWQAFYVAFFVISLGMTTLVCVRNIVRNGRDRFDAQPPIPLYRLFCSRRPFAMWVAFGLAHLPTIFTLAYVCGITIWEQEYVVFGPHYGLLWCWLAAGVIAAVAFWYLVSLFYLWTYPHAEGQQPTALIFPGSPPFFEAAALADKPLYAVWAEDIARRVLWVSAPGYVSKRRGGLRELHFLTTVALAAFLMLYLMLYPLTAPVYFSRGILDRIGAIVIFILCVVGSRTEHGHWERIGYYFLGVKLFFLLVFLWVIHHDAVHRTVTLETAFPTLASILVIFIFSQWFLAGASFFFDRYRAPVLSVIVLLVFLPKLLPIDQDHYFDAVKVGQVDNVDSPKDAIDHRVLNPDQPYIIVTATGGGIQAAAWTARIMAQLEKSFREDARLSQAHYTFHEHLLMASGVSGGSVGLMPFMLEYTAEKPFDAQDNDLQDRLTLGTECSSLEAVAWGLEYYDLQRFLFTYRPSSLHYTERDYPNVRARESIPFYPDRTWALTRAINRNLKDKDCRTDRLTRPKGLLDGEQLTLRQAAAKLREKGMPAFTFNTTVAETGGRFLLSNYAVPSMPADLINKTDFMPAASFLQVYTQQSKCDASALDGRCYADIGLSTAARLSATFPVVSSATRIPAGFAKTAAHFLDGGYYDNDGTASVSEFLYSAMEQRDREEFEAKEKNAKWNELKDPDGEEPGLITYPKPIRILLLEIRDGGDLNSAKNLDDWQHQTGLDVEPGASRPASWSIFDQLLSPLDGLWNAGHVSTTLRNRQQLCLLERAYGNRGDNELQIHHIVVGIPPATVEGKPDQHVTPPLSWKLTNRQAQYIQDWISGAGQDDPARKQTLAAIHSAIDWIHEFLPAQPTQAQAAAAVVSKSKATAANETHYFPTCELVPQLLGR